MTGSTKHKSLTSNSSPSKIAEDPSIKEPPTLSLEESKDEVDNVEYRFELARLQSFNNWPLSFVTPERLAAAGFYYFGEGDKVRCFECHTEISQWVEGDDPMVDHQRWSGRCRFIRRIPCGNVPIGVDPDTVPPPMAVGQDTCGSQGLEYRRNSSPQRVTFITDVEFLSRRVNNNKINSVSLVQPKGPAYPDYATYDARLKTFETWPKSMPQTKELMAHAGFYYTGKGDQTMCHHCGGGLKDWESDDEPWEEHARWFSKCYYLLVLKGQDFVNNFTGQSTLCLSKEETVQMALPTLETKVEESSPVESERNNEIESNPGPSHVKDPTAKTAEGSKELVPAKPHNSKSVDDASMCKICYNAELGVVFLPCGHMVACVKCAPGMTSCAVCREHVTMTIRAFLS